MWTKEIFEMKSNVKTRNLCHELYIKVLSLRWLIIKVRSTHVFYTATSLKQYWNILMDLNYFMGILFMTFHPNSFGKEFSSNRQATGWTSVNLGPQYICCLWVIAKFVFVQEGISVKLGRLQDMVCNLRLRLYEENLSIHIIMLWVFSGMFQFKLTANGSDLGDMN